jgi:lysophospholipase L1-like esterase
MIKVALGITLAAMLGNASAAESPLFKQYVALGDSLTQGVQGTSAEETRQPSAYPALLAKIMSTNYTQAPLTFPGNSINDEDYIKGNIKWWQFYYPIIGGHRKDGYKNQDTLNNFGISGAKIEHIIESKAKFEGMQKLVLGANGESAIDQAMKQNPTFVSVWIGHNDVLAAVARTDTTNLTPLADFEKSLVILIKKIKDTPSVQGVVLANLVDITQLPYLETVNLPEYPAGSKRVYYKSDANIKGPHQVLDPSELALIKERLQAINALLKKAAADNGWAFVDFHQFYLNVVKRGHLLRGENGFSNNDVITTEYLGGLFSLDGMHISTTGQAVFANEFINAINQHYLTSLPNVNEVAVSQKDSLYQNPVNPRQQ